MRKVWKFYNRQITTTEIEQLKAAHIEVFVGDMPSPIEIKTMQSIITVDLFLPDVVFYTLTEQQETLLALMFGKNVQWIGQLNDQLYY